MKHRTHSRTIYVDNNYCVALTSKLDATPTRTRDSANQAAELGGSSCCKFASQFGRAVTEGRLLSGRERYFSQAVQHPADLAWFQQNRSVLRRHRVSAGHSRSRHDTAARSVGKAPVGPPRSQCSRSPCRVCSHQRVRAEAPGTVREGSSGNSKPPVSTPQA